ncbi:transketolase [uncultured Thermanaerothrix sp.]|uniref:transketolase n=1 Tax=uncultured Thermanaerothrix sp. TaxID=1195149 RepID=UPI002624C2D9|nr:transketolase [uncultured Thermanaerothrix sp.]
MSELSSLIHDLELKSVRYRKSILSMIKHANSGHTGGSLSCIDILNVLYNHVLNVDPNSPSDPDRDRYIHSKGHSVEALYVVLADRGFLPAEEIYTFEQYGSRLIGHPTRKVPGIEQNTGALGHGLSVAVGMALAAKKDQRNYRVFTLLGDGELTEGSVWEACMSASHYQLDNLVVIVDRNGLQITGPTEEVMRLEPLEEKFRAFGLAVRSVDGNSIPQLLQVFEQIPFEKGKPSLILAFTVKGKGVSFMESNALWHHRVPNDQEYEQAVEELEQVETQLSGTRLR